MLVYRGWSTVSLVLSNLETHIVLLIPPVMSSAYGSRAYVGMIDFFSFFNCFEEDAGIAIPVAP